MVAQLINFTKTYRVLSIDIPTAGTFFHVAETLYTSFKRKEQTIANPFGAMTRLLPMSTDTHIIA